MSTCVSPAITLQTLVVASISPFQTAVSLDRKFDIKLRADLVNLGKPKANTELTEVQTALSGDMGNYKIIKCQWLEATLKTHQSHPPARGRSPKLDHTGSYPDRS